MARQKIVLVGYEEDGVLYTMLDYAPGDDDLIDENPQPTLEELADFCDQKAEDRNNHEFVGVHRLLAGILYKRVGRIQAGSIMREIAEYGGLDAASGNYWRQGGDAYAEFGVPDAMREWQLGE